MPEENLWNQFNLAKNNPDPGAGILYCMRYDKDRIEGHQYQVVQSLQSLGVELEDLGGDGIGAKFMREPSASERRRAISLFEELSCLNEAMEHKGPSLEYIKSVLELKDFLVQTFYGLLLKGDILNAYDLVSSGIPQIVNDLKVAHAQNHVLSKSELDGLGELASFARRKEKMDNITVIFG